MVFKNKLLLKMGTHSYLLAVSSSSAFQYIGFYLSFLTLSLNVTEEVFLLLTV